MIPVPVPLVKKFRFLRFWSHNAVPEAGGAEDGAPADGPRRTSLDRPKSGSVVEPEPEP